MDDSGSEEVPSLEEASELEGTEEGSSLETGSSEDDGISELEGISDGISDGIDELGIDETWLLFKSEELELGWLPSQVCGKLLIS